MTGRLGQTYTSSTLSGTSTDETANRPLPHWYHRLLKKTTSHKLASLLCTFTNKGHTTSVHTCSISNSACQATGRRSLVQPTQSFPHVLSCLARAASSVILGLHNNIGHEAQFIHIIPSTVRQPFIRCLFPYAKLREFCPKTLIPYTVIPWMPTIISPLLACSITGTCLLYSNLNHYRVQFHHIPFFFTHHCMFGVPSSRTLGLSQALQSRDHLFRPL